MSSNGITFSVKISSYFQVALSILLSIKYYFVKIYEYNVFPTIEGVLTVFYGIFSTIYLVAVIIGTIVLWLYAFTSKVDSINYSHPSIDNKIKMWLKRVCYYGRNAIFVVLSSMTDHQYLSSVCIIILVLDVITIFLSSKVRVKSALLTLSGEKNE